MTGADGHRVRIGLGLHRPVDRDKIDVMVEAAPPTPSDVVPDSRVLLPLARAWFAAGIVTFGISAAIAYDPSFDTPIDVAVTLLPIALAVALVVAFAAPLRDSPRMVQVTATLVTIACWVALMFDDTNWSILAFALYALCFSLGPVRGIAAAAVVTVAWAAALVAEGDAGWVLIGPVAAFAAGSAISITLWGASERNDTQAALIAELRATRGELADAEREKGMLEERARFAGEIHDTLAQGFTSIVLLSRAAQRNETWREGMTAIEETAEENLAAARRLVAAIGPAELDHSSLPDAIERQIATTLDDEIGTEFRVVGEPRPLSGALNVTILRAAQEALLNVRTHSRASHVHTTLTYLDDLVVLDVRDDGVGFTPGTTSERGSLTGGQGLKALEHRAASLGGQLTIEAREGGGAAVSLQIPVPPS